MTPGTDSFPLQPVADAVGSTPVAWTPVTTRGYARSCGHWRVSFADGSSAFVKHALTPDAAGWLRTERLIYDAVCQPFMPTFLGAHDDSGSTLIVLEDLTDAEWPPPWSRDRVDAVLAALHALHRTEPPEGIETLTQSALRSSAGRRSPTTRSRCSRRVCARRRGWSGRCRRW